MRKTPILLLGLCCLLFCSLSTAATTVSSLPITEKKINSSDPALPYHISVKEFLSLTPEKYKQLTGKRLSFLQRIALKLEQQRIKRSLKKKEPAILSDFDPIGFVLGLFISIFGVGISYLINYKDTRKWAWIGAGIGAIFILIAVLL